MAYVGEQKTVANTPTLIVESDADGSSALLTNRGTVSVFTGASNVTTTGSELKPGEAKAIDLDSGEKVYGITASGTCRVDVDRNRAAA